MFGSILHRMILGELIKVFGMSLIGITGILLMAGIVAEASQQGLGPTQILAAIPLLIPSTLPYTIPATTLFASCVVYGRLSADNEILAIRAAGINLGKVVKPGLILGLAMSAVTMGLYYRIIPYTHMLLRAMVFSDAEELLYSMLRKNGEIKHSQTPYSIFVKEVKGKKLLDPIIKVRNKEHPTKIDLVARAREADLRVDVANKILLLHMRFGYVTGEDGSSGDFADRVFDVQMPDGWTSNKERRPRDMTWQEILERKREVQAKIEADRVEADLAAASMMLNGAADDLPKHQKNLLNRIAFNRSLITQLNVELLMRPALSVGCICFILVGCPVGIWFSRSDYLSSFITCFLPIVFVYYPLTLCGTGMAKEGRFDPISLVWGADVVLALVGVGLFWRLLRK